MFQRENISSRYLDISTTYLKITIIIIIIIIIIINILIMCMVLG